MRSALLALLGREPDFVIAGQASTLDDELGALVSAEVLVWDVGSSVAAAPDRELLLRTPAVALVSDEESALRLLRAGVLGVLLRGARSERLLAAIRTVASGLSVFDPALLRSLLSTRAASRDALLLTPREAEVLSLMAEGLSNKLIADRLKISEHTAKFHVNAILNKLDAETRTEAVVSAARRGLLML